jgi:exonuclease VII small subunit
MYEVAIVPFQKTSGFISIRDSESGEIYVSPKTICEAFAMNWAAQQQKLAMNAQRWGYQKISVTLPGDTQEREVSVIPDRKVRSWICGISSEKVKPDIREQLLAFQDECDEVLYNYWTKGAAINPRHIGSLQTQSLVPSPEWKVILTEVVEKAIDTRMEPHLKTLEVISANLQSAAKSLENANAMLERSAEKMAKLEDKFSSKAVRDTVKTTLSEIRNEDPVYLAAKKWDTIERMHMTRQFSEDELKIAQKEVLGLLAIRTEGNKCLDERGLTHAAEFLQKKAQQGYHWAYKTLEAAAAQLTKIAHQLWLEDGYSAWKEQITLQTGRTVDAYVFPVKYAQAALETLMRGGKVVAGLVGSEEKNAQGTVSSQPLLA